MSKFKPMDKKEVQQYLSSLSSREKFILQGWQRKYNAAKSLEELDNLFTRDYQDAWEYSHADIPHVRFAYTEAAIKFD